MHTLGKEPLDPCAWASQFSVPRYEYGVGLFPAAIFLSSLDIPVPCLGLLNEQKMPRSVWSSGVCALCGGLHGVFFFF